MCYNDVVGASEMEQERSPIRKPRRRRGDRRVGRLEKEFGLDFGVRSDMRLSTLRDRLGERELQRLLAAADSAEVAPRDDLGHAA